MNSDWESVKRFYVEQFGVDPELVDMVAMGDVLLLSVSGSSNSSISKFLNIDKKVVKEILDTVLDFEGWKEDIEINPYSIFTNLLRNNQLNSSSFVREINSIERNIKMEDISKMYRICSIFCTIERRIDQEWV
jgi:hypothetical protein